MSPFGLENSAGVHPAGVHLFLLDAIQGYPYGFPTAHEFLGNNLLNPVLGADRIAGQPLGQWQRNGFRDRAD